MAGLQDDYIRHLLDVLPADDQVAKKLAAVVKARHPSSPARRESPVVQLSSSSSSESGFKSSSAGSPEPPDEGSVYKFDDETPICEFDEPPAETGNVTEPGDFLSLEDHCDLQTRDTKRYFNFFERLAADDDCDLHRVPWARWNEFIKRGDADSDSGFGGDVERLKLDSELKQSSDSPSASASRAAANDAPQHKKSGRVEKKGGGKDLDTTQPPN